MRKKFLCLLCLTALLISFGYQPILAADLDTPVQEELPEEYQYISGSYTSAIISGSYVKCFATVQANCKASISITMTLQRRPTSGSSWSDVQSWHTQGTSNSLSLEKSSSASHGYTYRTKAVYTVNGETITKYSTTVSY
ncbi:MAG: hypothetical protein IJ567_01235 [Lachnospiraceae bacterium]|nr:hypothetical protein [Lachnospiraceae bacterium]